MVWNQIPTRMRQLVNYAWLKCLIAPCAYLKGLFDTNRAANLYFLAHNSQVCFIQAAINDTFDPVSRRLYIADPQYDDPLVVFTVTEIPPDTTVPLYLASETTPTGAQPILPLYLESEVGIDNNCFVVMVPTALALTSDQINQLRGMVDEYRLPGKNNYTIAFF